ncbi:hypothetical protein KFE96_11985 [Kordiimonas sp. SCSIO 12603]|uniref:DUF6898 family protein n=1 Tax=Kordiimonas sp. SCSIO 12603 TaxID=2829596 RepID=UPI002101F18F|nr:hypothetical protein [Kordiimonas sp. SCSIO 12603]UTW57557.1 hypothetical protein KFE96_11985 [Kordiimonas sp. SCSIO 12603]
MAGDVIVEFVRVGNMLKVSAVCARTGREISIAGDPKAPRAQLEKIAIDKLRYVMKKDAAQTESVQRGILI